MDAHAYMAGSICKHILFLGGELVPRMQTPGDSHLVSALQIFGNLPALQNKLKTCKELGRVRDWRRSKQCARGFQTLIPIRMNAYCFAILQFSGIVLHNLLRRFECSGRGWCSTKGETSCLGTQGLVPMVALGKGSKTMQSLQVSHHSTLFSRIIKFHVYHQSKASQKGFFRLLIFPSSTSSMTLMPYCVDDLGESLIQLQLSCFHLHELLFQLVLGTVTCRSPAPPRRVCARMIRKELQ